MIKLKNILSEAVNESELKGYLIADVVDDIIKAIGPRFVSGEIKQSNRNKIYLKLTDVKVGSEVVKLLKSKFGIDAKEEMFGGKDKFGSIPSVSFFANKVINEKSDDDFADFISTRKSYSRPTNWKVIEKDGKYSFESDGFSRVRLMYNGKQIASGVNDWSTGGYEIEHSSWNYKEKPFQFAKDVIKYFKSKKITTESLNEAAVKTPDFIVTSIPADTIPPVNISKADVGLGLSMFDTLGRGWTLNNKDYKLDYHNGKVALVLTKQGKLAVRVKSGHDPKYVEKIEKFANDYLSKYAKDIKK
jgi:hypothetical protein